MKLFGCGCLSTLLPLLLAGLFVYAFHPWLLEQWGYTLLRSQPLRKSDVIVVMAGTYAIRAEEAAALYRENWSPRVLITREVPNDDFWRLREQGISVQESIDINQEMLQRLGVPRESIWRIEAPVGNTDQEIRHAGEFLKQQHVRRLIVVTSKTHSRRACLGFDHYYGADFQIICRYSRFDPFEPKLWWTRRRYVREFLFEWQKLLLYRLQFALQEFGL